MPEYYRPAKEPHRPTEEPHRPTEEPHRPAKADAQPTPRQDLPIQDQSPPIQEHGPTDPTQAARRADIASYLLALEECFLAIRGRGVQWSRTDLDVAEAWLGAAVPLGTALRVIQARVRAWRFRHGDLARLPMGLGYYSPAVIQAAKALGPLQMAPLSACPPALQPPSTPAHSATEQLPFAELLDPLPELVAQTRHLALQHAYRKAFDVLDEAQRPPAGWDSDARAGLDGPDPANALAKVRTQLRKLTVAGLTTAEAAALQAWLAPQLAGMALRMSRKATSERCAALEESWLAEHLQLKVPTLWGWLDPRDAA